MVITTAIQSCLSGRPASCPLDERRKEGSKEGEIIGRDVASREEKERASVLPLTMAGWRIGSSIRSWDGKGHDNKKLYDVGFQRGESTSGKKKGRKSTN